MVKKPVLNGNRVQVAQKAVPVPSHSKIGPIDWAGHLELATSRKREPLQAHLRKTSGL